MKGQFSGSVRWARVRSLFMMMMWLSWRTHMTHSWWVEKLLSVCRVDVSLWKVSEWTFEMDENLFSVRGVNELKNSYDSCNWLRVLVVDKCSFSFPKNTNFLFILPFASCRTLLIVLCIIVWVLLLTFWDHGSLMSLSWEIWFEFDNESFAKCSYVVVRWSTYWSLVYQDCG